MKRWLYHYRSVDGPPERLEQVLRHRARELLRTATADADAQMTAEGDLLVRLPASVLGRELSKTVRLHSGVAEQRGARTCIPLRWHADPVRHAFPSFDGTIELEPQSGTVAQLSVVGAATLPLGPVGRLADATALGAVADDTVRQLTDRLARVLEQAVSEGEPDDEEGEQDDGLTVRDVMTADPLVLDEDMPIKTAALLLFHYGVAGAPVRNDAGGLVGVLSETDLLDATAPLRYGLGRGVEASRRRRDARTAGESCSKPAREVAPTASVRQAAEMMRDHDVARLVVVEESEIVAVVSRHDVLRSIVRGDDETQTALRRLVAERDEDGVVATVEWGIAHLKGQVRLRSTVIDLVTQARSLDGVVGVDDDLEWEIDDVAAASVPTM